MDSCCIEPESGAVDPTSVTALETRVAALEASSPSVPETAGSAISIGTALYRASSGKMLTEDGSFTALREAFAGFSTTAAAADGDPVTVSGNGGIATGLTGITKGEGYYVSANVLIADTDLATWLLTATALAWYRFVGTGFSTTSIKQAWGEPQQVPAP